MSNEPKLRNSLPAKEGPLRGLKMRTLAPLGLVAILFAVAGCETKHVRSTGSGTTAGREVRFSLDGSGGIVTSANASTVTFAHGKIVVEKSRILVNDKEVATIADSAKAVEIDYTAGRLTIKADGANVHEATFK
jgi:hypothetical protein